MGMAGSWQIYWPHLNWLLNSSLSKQDFLSPLSHTDTEEGLRLATLYHHFCYSWSLGKSSTLSFYMLPSLGFQLWGKKSKHLVLFLHETPSIWVSFFILHQSRTHMFSSSNVAENLLLLSSGFPLWFIINSIFRSTSLDYVC